MFRDKTIAYLSFTRKERIGIFTLIFLILLLFIIPVFFTTTGWDENQVYFTHVETEIARLPAGAPDSLMESRSHAAEFRHADPFGKARPNPDQSLASRTLFDFDPNSIAAADWRLLGLQDRIIRIIQKYLGHGGRFRKPEDLKKIYGLTENQYGLLYPHIRIREREFQKPGGGPASGTRNPEAGDFRSLRLPRDSVHSGWKRIDINRADTLAWIRLRGIGPVLARRIVHFRTKLGGFYSVDQVAETFGLPDSVFRQIRAGLSIQADSLQKIELNQADLSTLRGHPYIGWKLARVIVEYRRQHGLFRDVGELEKLNILGTAEFHKLAPYLTITGN